MSERYPGAQVVADSGEPHFRTRYRSWQLGCIEFAEILSDFPQNLQTNLPEQAAPDSYYLPLQLKGEFRGGQYGRECCAGARSMLLVDSHAPHWRELGSDSHLLNVRLPKSLLECYLADPQAVCMMPVDADSGLGAVVWDFITSLWRRRAELTLTEVQDLSDTLARMIATLFGALRSNLRNNESGFSRSFDNQRCRLLEYITAHLNDPYLNVRKAAIACGISPRYVHLLMRATHRTFSRYLLEHRLEKCRLALQARENFRSITEIAFEWGFNDTSHFSRSFRHRYGVSPREARRSARLHSGR
ncbi:MAG TPA: helix-turn-helix domain-containing protein [Spongiibacteraceae bacterium]|nr:helix-turn-helix domain-containing protein [Spongiibacteraceae bacterium]